MQSHRRRAEQAVSYVAPQACVGHFSNLFEGEAVEKASCLNLLCFQYHVFVSGSSRHFDDDSLESEWQETNDGQEIYEGTHQAHRLWTVGIVSGSG